MADNGLISMFGDWISARFGVATTTDREDQPSFLNGKTTYTHSEILAILNNEEGKWYTKSE